MDRLDRYLSLHLLLDRSIDDAELPLSDLAEQLVAAERPSRSSEGLVLSKDPLVQVL